MRITEVLLIIFFIFGVLFHLLILSGGSLFIGVSLTLLACVYFNFGFLLFNGIRLRRIFKKDTYKGLDFASVIIAMIAGLSLSISLVGIMFYLLVLPGSLIMLLVGVWSLLFCSVIFSLIFFLKKIKTAKRALIRIIPVMIIAIWITTLDKYDWIEYRFRNYPDYIDAYKNAIEAESISEEEAERMHAILEEEWKKVQEERKD